jgi:hypothetical protein
MMLLLSHGIRFANPRCKFVVEIQETVEPKRVQVISRREGFDAQKTRMIKPARKNKVTNEKVAAHLHGDE